MVPSCEDIPPTVTLNIFSPVTVPLPAKRPAPSAAPSAPAAPDASGGGGKSDEKAKSPAEGAGGGKKDDKKKKKKGEGGGDSGGSAEGGSKKGAAAAPAAAAAAAPAAAVEGDPSKLDVRVGVIVKAWEHPDSDKLFCEEIDLGEVSASSCVLCLVSFCRIFILFAPFVFHVGDRVRRRRVFEEGSHDSPDR